MMQQRPEAGRPASKLLIPIDANDESRWGVQYALALSHSVPGVQVCLLWVNEPMRSWEVLSFHTAAEVKDFFAQRSSVFLEEAARDLRAAGLAFELHQREGETVRSIIDFAEAQGCSAIVVPQRCCCGLLPCGLAHRLRRGKGKVPVIAVDAHGVPQP